MLLVDAISTAPHPHSVPWVRSEVEQLSSVADMEDRRFHRSTRRVTLRSHSSNPTELLSSRYMAELLSQAADRYDQVISTARRYC